MLTTEELEVIARVQEAYCGPNALLREDQRADRCTECGDCEEACPQGIAVPEWRKKAHELLGPRR